MKLDSDPHCCAGLLIFIFIIYVLKLKLYEDWMIFYKFWFTLIYCFSFWFSYSSVMGFDFGSKNIVIVRLFMNLSFVILVFGLVNLILQLYFIYSVRGIARIIIFLFFIYIYNIWCLLCINYIIVVLIWCRCIEPQNFENRSYYQYYRIFIPTSDYSINLKYCNILFWYWY